MDSLRLFLLDQGFPVEHELDEFNTPHTETTLLHSQNWLCRLQCRILLQHQATSSLGNIFWRHSHFSPKQPEPQTHGDFNVSLLKQQKHDFCYTMVNISSLHIQQCLNLTMHFLLRHLAAKMLSPLSHNSISFPCFFPSSETRSINVDSLFHAAIKNLPIKANVIFLLLYPPLNTFLSDHDERFYHFLTHVYFL